MYYTIYFTKIQCFLVKSYLSPTCRGGSFLLNNFEKYLEKYLEKSRYFLISFEEKCAILEKKKKGVLEHGECL